MNEKATEDHVCEHCGCEKPLPGTKITAIPSIWRDAGWRVFEIPVDFGPVELGRPQWIILEYANGTRIKWDGIEASLDEGLKERLREERGDDLFRANARRRQEHE